MLVQTIQDKRVIYKLFQTSITIRSIDHGRETIARGSGIFRRALFFDIGQIGTGRTLTIKQANDEIYVTRVKEPNECGVCGRKTVATNWCATEEIGATTERIGGSLTG